MRLAYDYEPSPGDGWPSSAAAARLWVKGWIEGQSTWRLERYVSVERRGPLWHVEVDAKLCDCDKCREAGVSPGVFPT